MVIFLWTLSCTVSWGQYIYGISTEWDDSFKEWIIWAEEEEFDGSLSMRWPLRNDWSEWDFEFSGQRGAFYLKRQNDPEYWEGSMGNQLVSCRTVWPGDRRSWMVVQGDKRMQISTAFGNIADEWIAEDSRYGRLRIFTDWEGDPRDWIIEDELSDEIPLLMKLMMIHIALMQSIPRI